MWIPGSPLVCMLWVLVGTVDVSSGCAADDEGLDTSIVGLGAVGTSVDVESRLVWEGRPIIREEMMRILTCGDEKAWDFEFGRTLWVDRLAKRKEFSSMITFQDIIIFPLGSKHL